MANPNPVPEGIPYAVPADPAAKGKDALEVSYDDYADKVNDPVAQDIARGYAPGTSPEALTVRGRKGEYTGSDKVEYPEGAAALVPPEVEYQTAAEKIEEADAGHDADRDPEEAAEAAADPSQPSSDNPETTPDGSGAADGSADGSEADAATADADADNSVPEADAVNDANAAEAQTAQGEQYDPNEHTVAEVNDYLATADDAEKERVIEAEKAGQARTTIVGK